MMTIQSRPQTVYQLRPHEDWERARVDYPSVSFPDRLVWIKDGGRQADDVQATQTRHSSYQQRKNLLWYVAP